jgi:hypothetical protein
VFPIGRNHGGGAAAAMSSAAERVIAALPSEQQAALRFPFDDPRRREWHYTPGRRRGVSLAEMARAPAKAVHDLLITALSRPTHTRVAVTIGLEDILDEAEGGRRGRHAGDYWTAVFGDPGDDVWGWRFEGHHISINVTLTGDMISATPFFLGANPATITDHDGRTISRPLAPEEDVALALIGSFDRTQRERAVIADEAPADILSGDAAEVPEETPGWAAGLPATALRPDQVSGLRDLAAIYVNRLAADLAEPLLTQLDKDLPGFNFSWAGPTAPATGRSHYYRLDGPRFLVEFDNGQHGANHIHSVWRDPGGDFGARLLPN